MTIRERAIERAIELKKQGIGPDRILVMLSTSESHYKKNSGLAPPDYRKMCEEWIPKAREERVKVKGTVSTIWECPIEGPTKMEKAVEFAQRWLEIGAMAERIVGRRLRSERIKRGRIPKSLSGRQQTSSRGTQ